MLVELDHTDPITLSTPLIGLLVRMGMRFNSYHVAKETGDRIAHVRYVWGDSDEHLLAIFNVSNKWGYKHKGNFIPGRGGVVVTEQDLANLIRPTPLYALYFNYKLNLFHQAVTE